MTVKEFLAMLAEVLFKPRNSCPHCGGHHCMGVCGLVEKRGSAREKPCDGANKTKK